jgi:hypothetical protein
MTIATSAYDAHIAHGDKPVELFFRDADGDGFGSPSEVITECDVPAGYVEDDTDCDDGNAAVYPGALEIAGNDIIEEALVGFQGRGGADGVQPDFGHSFLLEALIFQ